MIPNFCCAESELATLMTFAGSQLWSCICRLIRSNSANGGLVAKLNCIAALCYLVGQAATISQ